MRPDAPPAGAPAPLTERVQRRLLAASRDSISDAPRISEAVRAEAPLLPSGSVDVVASSVLDRAQGLGPLEPLLADPDVTEVMVNGPGPVWIERHGRLERTSIVLDAPDDRHSRRAGRRAARACGSTARRPWSTPACPTAPGSTSSCRRWRSTDPASPSAGSAAATIALAAFCPPGVASSCGGRLRAASTWSCPAARARARPRCSTHSPPHCRPGARRHGRGRRRAAAARRPRRPPRGSARRRRRAGRGHVRDLVRNALRMRPDRIVVGEVRGREALDMLQAMNTGHEGSLSTCHANSPPDALRRLETMVLMGDVALPLAAVRDQVPPRSTSSCRSPARRWPARHRRRGRGRRDRCRSDGCADPRRPPRAPVTARAPLSCDRSTSS